MTHGKGKVESGVGHAQKTPLKGMRFESSQEAQAYLDRMRLANPICTIPVASDAVMGWTNQPR
jgi:hypothetical protein